MPRKSNQHDKQFKLDAIQYVSEHPDCPNAVWCTAITYIWTRDGFVYLTSIMDLYTRKIIAWTLSKTMEVSYVVDTINEAEAKRNTDLPLILHSGCGSQYVSKAYRETTKKYQLSYRHKGCPYDNTCIESFQYYSALYIYQSIIIKKHDTYQKISIVLLYIYLNNY